MFITQIPYDEYENLSVIVDYNINNFITGSNIIIPCIKEKIIDYNDTTNIEITELFENDIILSVTQSAETGSQIIL